MHSGLSRGVYHPSVDLTCLNEKLITGKLMGAQPKLHYHAMVLRVRFRESLLLSNRAERQNIPRVSASQRHWFEEVKHHPEAAVK
jgi:hypothetical protein